MVLKVDSNLEKQLDDLLAATRKALEFLRHPRPAAGIAREILEEALQKERQSQCKRGE